jgi:hypothetical protein
MEETLSGLSGRGTGVVEGSGYVGRKVPAIKTYSGVGIWALKRGGQSCAF